MDGHRPGLFKEEGKARFGENYRMWQKDAANFEIDGHYPVRELWARAAACWQEILRSEGRSVLVVAHNAVNQALVATATEACWQEILRSEGRSVLVVAHNAVNQALIATATGRGGCNVSVHGGTWGWGISCSVLVVTHNAVNQVARGHCHRWCVSAGGLVHVCERERTAAACWQEILRSEGRSVLVVAHYAVNQALVATATEQVRTKRLTEAGVEGEEYLLPYVCLSRLNQVQFRFHALLHCCERDRFLLTAPPPPHFPSPLPCSPTSPALSPLTLLFLQTPAPPVITGGVSGGRKAKARVILVHAGGGCRRARQPHELLPSSLTSGTQDRRAASRHARRHSLLLATALTPSPPLPAETPAPPVMTGGASGRREEGQGSSDPRTPAPPVMASGGRKAKARAILVCHGDTNSSAQRRFPQSPFEQLSMLGVVQARKTAELLLDLRVDTVFCSPLPRAVRTAEAVVEVQEAAECLGADCVPRFVDVVPVEELRELEYGTWQGAMMAEVSAQERWEDQLRSSPPPNGESLPSLWGRAEKAWTVIRRHLAEVERATSASAGADVAAAGPGSPPIERSETVIVVGHETVFQAMLASCLKLPHDALGSFRLDPGSITVVDFPDGVGEPKESSESDNKGNSAAGAGAAGRGIAAGVVGQGVVRCINYTAHLGRWAVPVTLPTSNDEDF
ncbi:unnamed protein product [Closterium sp. NIES-64]|nr:unnamed protein product [Closterium sp. NIES-64]